MALILINTNKWWQFKNIKNGMTEFNGYIKSAKINQIANLTMINCTQVGILGPVKLIEFVLMEFIY